MYPITLNTKTAWSKLPWIQLSDSKNPTSKDEGNNKKPEEGEIVTEETPITTDWEEIMKKNKENAERVKKERAKQNKGVLYSYRIKKD